VALAGLEPDRLERLAEELEPNAAWFQADVRQMDQVQNAVAGAVERFGRLDVVIANAGVAPVGTVQDIDPADFENTIQVNLLGMWRTLRAALPHIVEARGYALTIASLAAMVHLPLMASYAAAKAGVSALADSLRIEVEGQGVAVGCAYFGFIDTDMTRNALSDPGTQALHPQVRRRLIGRPLPVAMAADAIVQGVERRARWIVVPRSALPALWAPALAQRTAEKVARRFGLTQNPPRTMDRGDEGIS
jgi:NAD(P)-dependent dehydrogenase (short-subunit alcohol dehydrogenase family)